MTPHLWQKVKSLLMKVKEDREKVGLFRKLSHGIWSHLMASRWGNNGNSERLILGEL